MKVNSISSVFLFVAVVHAYSHGPAHGSVHKARSNGHVDDLFVSSLNVREVSPADCDQRSLLGKVMSIVPTSLVSAMLAQPTPFSNDNPPEFWSKFTDHEKDCLLALYPAKDTAAAKVAGSVPEKEECTTTTTTSTISRTLTVTLPPTPTSTSVTVQEKDCTTTITSTITQTSTIILPSTSTNTPVVSSSASNTGASKMAPYGNGTAAHTVPAVSGTGTGNQTSLGLPEFTAGQGMVGVGLFSSAMSAAIAVTFGLLT